MNGPTENHGVGLGGVTSAICFVALLLWTPGCGVKKFNDLKKKHRALESRQMEIEKESERLRNQLEAVKSTSLRTQRWSIHPYREDRDLLIEGEKYIRNIRFQRKGSVVTATVTFDPGQSIKPQFKLYWHDQDARVCGEVEVRWLVYRVSKDRQDSITSTEMDAGKTPHYFSLRFSGS